MANPIAKLPNEVKDLIKAYYSDKYEPHPTAKMISELVFIRFSDTEFTGTSLIYFPYLKIWNPRDRRERRFLLTDFALPIDGEGPYTEDRWYPLDRYVQDSDRDSGIVLGRVL